MEKAKLMQVSNRMFPSYGIRLVSKLLIELKVRFCLHAKSKFLPFVHVFHYPTPLPISNSARRCYFSLFKFSSQLNVIISIHCLCFAALFFVCL